VDFGILGVGSGGRAGPGANAPGRLRNNYILTMVTSDLKVLNTFLFSPDFLVVSGTSEPSPCLETISSLGSPEPPAFCFFYYWLLPHLLSLLGCQPLNFHPFLSPPQFILNVHPFSLYILFLGSLLHSQLFLPTQIFLSTLTSIKPGVSTPNSIFSYVDLYHSTSFLNLFFLSTWHRAGVQ